MQSSEKRPKMLDFASLEPATRVKQLANYGTVVEVDPNVPPRRYYRSGLEMVRMANVYLAEGSLENAYILYMKFMTLFVEKIRKHPEYNTVPSEVKAVNQSMLKEVMPKAEKLKQKLLEQYKREHEQYLENEENKRKAEEARRKQEQEDEKLAQRLQADENKQDGHKSTPHLLNAEDWAVTPTAPPVDGVLYPDDFATEPPRAPPHHYYPTPPLIPPSKPHDAGINDYLPTLIGERRLRMVVVPAGLLPKFLALAASNTARNIELCGILAGILERDQLKITHVVVPKQTGTADSCSTNNEEEIFHYQDQHNLITLGWIHPNLIAFGKHCHNCGKWMQRRALLKDDNFNYCECCGLETNRQLRITKARALSNLFPKNQAAPDSSVKSLAASTIQPDKSQDLFDDFQTHPTQTAFLSSVDLHTQCSYQLMMPEAIAIVCAPKYNETGYFALTSEYGMQYIANCRQSGFHPHPNDPPLFCSVSHIKLDESAPVEMVDLRR